MHHANDNIREFFPVVDTDQDPRVMIMNYESDDGYESHDDYESDNTSVESIPVTFPSILTTSTTLTLTVSMYNIMVIGLKSVEYRPNTAYYRNRFFDSYGRRKIQMIKFGKAYFRNRPFFYGLIDHVSIVHEVDEFYGNVHVSFPYRLNGYFAIHLVQETISL